MIFLVPQGRILTRALIDYPSFSRSPWRYVIINEILLCGYVSTLAWLKWLF